MSTIAICSDSHDNIPNISKFLFYCNNNNVDAIIHCGDWCAPSVLKFYRENFKGAIYGVMGNVHDDAENVEKVAQKQTITIKKDRLELELYGIKILITHYPDVAKSMAEMGKYQMIFYGHNHKPWQEKVNNAFLINPGTLAGMFYRASFAVYDAATKKLELKILDTMMP